MNPEELSAQLSRAADLAGPGEVSVDLVRNRVRRKRWVRGASVAGASLAVVSLGALVLPQMTGQPQTVAAGPGKEPAGKKGMPTSEFVCGKPWDDSGTARSRDGLSVTVQAAKPTDGSSGPVLQVFVESDRPRTVVTSAARNVQIVYLRNGLVVGGGPLLREPGDRGLQITDFAGQGLAAAPGKPGMLNVGRRDALCPSTSWKDIWSDPASYEVVVTMAEPVNAGPSSPAKRESVNLIDRKPLG